MAQEKIKFFLTEIKIVDDYLDKNVVNSIFPNNDPDKVFFGIDVNTKTIPDDEKIVIRVTVVFRLKDEKEPFAKFTIDNFFTVHNLKKLVSSKSKNVEPELRNTQFHFYLVDCCISHMRAFQALTMKDYKDKEIPFVPFISAHKFSDLKKGEKLNS